MRLAAVSAILLSGMLSACFKRPLYAPIKHAESITEKEKGSAKVDLLVGDPRLETDLRRLESYSGALKDMAAEMGELRKNSQVYTTDYFEPREHDRIEGLIFRYLLCRGSLWEMVHYYFNYRDLYTDPVLQTKAFITGFSAGLHIVAYSSLMAATFIKEPAGMAKINEAYPRSDIPRGTYDMILERVTSVENLKALKIAWELFDREDRDTASLLHRIGAADRRYAGIMDGIRVLHRESEERVEYVLKEKSLLLPKVVNQLRHSVIAALADDAAASIGDNLYAVRGLIFTAVGDFKMPAVRPLTFTPEQRKAVHSLIKPGDIILTFSAGYMSNIFLPGNFKHGIAFVGSVEERRKVGLAAGDSAARAKGAEILAKNISKERLESGHEADVIEAVSEGVVFNSLDRLLEGHVNRMLILRPLLSPEDRARALTDAFTLLESRYDFKFDFNDGSAQCCTEILYRMLNSRGPYRFTLTKRAGYFTLTADDIVAAYLKTEPRPFEFVLYADEDAKAGKDRAALHAGKSGEEYFTSFITAREAK